MATAGDASEAEKGKVIRLSKAAENYLKKRQHDDEKLNDTLRRILGLPNRRGEAQPLRIYYVVPNGHAPIVRLSLAEARGEAILLATRKKLKKAEAVIIVQEMAG